MSGKRARLSEVEEGEGEEAVGRVVECSQADDRRVIQLVRERRLLYARNNMPVASYYSQVKKLWQQVADQMGWTVAEVRRKWSHIRNSYSRHLRNEMYGARTGRGRQVSRWYLADELAFLREHMATDTRPPPKYAYLPLYMEMKGPKKEEPDTSEPPASPAGFSVEPLISARPWFALSSPATPAVTSRLNEPRSPLSPERDDNSAYFQFFRGIYHDYAELSAGRQREFRRECLTLLHRLLDAEAGAGEPLDSDPGVTSDDERDNKMLVLPIIQQVSTAPATSPQHILLTDSTTSHESVNDMAVLATED